MLYIYFAIQGVPRGNGITSSVCLEIKKVIHTMDPALLDFDLFEKIDSTYM